MGDLKVQALWCIVSRLKKFVTHVHVLWAPSYPQTAHTESHHDLLQNTMELFTYICF